MKKLLSIILSVAMILSMAVSVSAMITADETPDVVKDSIDLQPLNLDATDIFAYAAADDGRIAIIGDDKQGDAGLWFIDGLDVTKCDTDLSSIAKANFDIPDGDDIRGGSSVSFSDVYYFDGAFYVVCESSYYCMCDDYGPHDFTGLCVLLRTENGKDFTAVKMPSFIEPMFLGESGAIVMPFGDKLIYAANAAGFTTTSETTDEYGYPRQKGVSYYYTSEDSVNWTRHASIEIEAMYMEEYFWLFEGISEDGCAVFQLFSEAPSTTGGSCHGYYCTTDFENYTKLPEEVFGDEYCHNTLNLSRSDEYDDQMAILMQIPLEFDEETFGLMTTGLNVFAADSVDGEWEKKVSYEGEWNYYQYYYSDKDACVMLYTSDSTITYKWNGADGDVTTDTIDLDPNYIGGGIGSTYKDTMVFYMLYEGNSLLISKDMWDSYMKVELPKEFTSAVGIGDKMILVGEECCAIDLDDLGAAVVDGEGGVKIDLFGDADGNGSVNLSDVSSVLKKVAGWDVVINETLSDVTADGAINLADASLMLKYIAGWDVVLG